ncbi:MAG: helix-turn-helix domain-containing protein [Candidatus Bathyarchaeota archaeon]|nr:helix-turn-helix domain-containing protein [Candidatus Termiticorpusculum sp.]
MPKLMYKVNLTEEEQTKLIKITTTGKTSAKEILHANILLATADNKSAKLTISEVAQKCNTTNTTTQIIRKTYAQNDLNTALTRKKRTTPPIKAKITGEVEAHIIALTCTKPPKGHAKWSLRLLANKTVKLGYIDQISYVSVGTVLKKRSCVII